MKPRCVVALLTAVACATAAHAQPEGWYISEWDYDVGYPNTLLPDFDQVRQFSEQTPALPGNGSMYCAPTSAINLMAYLANTVTPFLSPYPENWMNYTRISWDTASIDNYNEITKAIREMGVLMNTSATGGTSTANMISASEQWLTTYATGADLRDVFEVSFWGPDGRDWTDNDITTIKPKEMAQYLWRGDVLAGIWGYYEVAHFTHVLVERHGGHVITPYRINGDNPGRSPRMTYRNPSGAWGDTTIQQDVFNSTTRDLSITYFMDDDRDSMQRYGVFKSLETISHQDLNENVVLLDGAMTISTRGVFAISPGHNPLVFDYDAVAGIVGLDEFDPPNAENIQDAELSPDKLAIATLTTGNGTANSANLYVLPVFGDPAPLWLDVLTDPAELVYNRQRCIIVRTAEQLRLYNPYLDDEHRIALVNDPIKIDAMDVHDATDELLLYSSFEGLLLRRDARDLTLLGDLFLPPTAPVAEMLHVNPADGSVWVYAEEALHRFEADGEFGMLHQVIPAPFPVMCFSFDERGHLYLGEGEPDQMIIHHFQTLGDRIQFLGTSPFEELEVPGCFDISRGRINLDHDLHLAPGSYHVDPAEQEAEEDQAPDPGQCPADLNNDGFLDSGDISAFVSFFLAGDLAVDLNNDGFLDSGDISAFVSLFLAGC